MAVNDYPLRGGQTIPSRNTAAGGSPGAFRPVEYIDQNGVPTGEWRLDVLLFNGTGAAINATPGNDLGKLYMVDETGVITTGPRVITCAVSTPTKNVVVAVESVAAGALGWFAISGVVNAALHGTTDIAIGDKLKLTIATSAVALLRDGGATETTSTFATAMTAQTTDGVTIPDPSGSLGTVIVNKVKLEGDKRVIA